MIRVVCNCGRAFKAEDRHAGRRTNCPECGAILTIGQTPLSSSSGSDVDTQPAWWKTGGEPRTKVPPYRDGSNGNETPHSDTVTLPFDNRPIIAAGAYEQRIPGAISTAGKPGLVNPSAAPRPRRSLLFVKLGAVFLGVLALGIVVGLTAKWIRPLVIVPGAVASHPAKSAQAVVSPSKSGASPPAVAKTIAKTAGGTKTPVAVAKAIAPAKKPTVSAKVAPTPAPRPVASSRLKMLIPAYIYPAGAGLAEWRKLFEAAAKVDIVAIANPDSGPGIEPNLDYAAIFGEAVKRHVTIVGYVTIDYGRRDAAKIKAQIDDWFKFYPDIAGIFFDQQPSDPKAVPLLSEMHDYVKNKKAKAMVISNPGMICDEAYLSQRVADVVCVYVNFEGFDKFELPTGLKNYEASRFAAMPYNVAGTETMRAAVRDAIVKKIGYLFVSDAKPQNQWSRLPSYWNDEVEAVARVR
jgi:hypothetical protein